MDVRIETFMRDAASDRGKPAAVVAEATALRLRLLLAGMARDGGAQLFLAGLETRIRDEMSRYPGTRTEAHLACVLGIVQGSAPAPSQRVA